MKWRTQRVREDADGEVEELIAARPPEAAYGKYVHCGFCSVAQKVSTIPIGETHIQCPYCGRGIEVFNLKYTNPYVEHGPPVTPAA